MSYNIRWAIAVFQKSFAGLVLYSDVKLVTWVRYSWDSFNKKIEKLSNNFQKFIKNEKCLKKKRTIGKKNGKYEKKKEKCLKKNDKCQNNLHKSIKKR